MQNNNASPDSSLLARARIIERELDWYAFRITCGSSGLDLLDELLTIGWARAGDFDVVQAETVSCAIRALPRFDTEFGDERSIEAACRLVCSTAVGVLTVLISSILGLPVLNTTILILTVMVLAILILAILILAILILAILVRAFLVLASIAGKSAIGIDVSGSLVCQVSLVVQVAFCCSTLANPSLSVTRRGTCWKRLNPRGIGCLNTTTLSNLIRWSTNARSALDSRSLR